MNPVLMFQFTTWAKEYVVDLQNGLLIMVHLFYHYSVKADIIILLQGNYYRLHSDKTSEINGTI